MAELQMRFLGDIDLAIDGEPLRDLKSKKAAALLCYLAITGATHDRLFLATLLWADTPESNARMNLRKVVAILRKLLDPYLVITKETMALDKNHKHWIDVQILEGGAKQLRVSADGGHQPDHLQEAVDVYRGDFLAGFYVRNAPLFEEWVLAQQARLRESVLDILPELANQYAERNQMTKAIDATRRLLQMDPWREEAHRQLMLFMAQDGRHSEALAQFEVCRQILAREFNTEPAEATLSLYETIRDKRFEPLGDHQDDSGLEAFVSRSRQPPSPYRGLFAFREQDARFFFGREQISERLMILARKQSLIAIVGPSGSGKSSLAAAGLAAALRAERVWQIAILRPGSQPLRALAAALVLLLEPQLGETDRLVEAGRIATAMREGVLSLASVLDRVHQMSEPAGRLLLLVDQFEELYVLCTHESERQTFLAQLLKTVDEQRLRSEPATSIGLTMRADFMEQALANRQLADALQDSTLILGPMNRDELSRAIEEPAKDQGVAFEAGLVTRIMDDVGPGRGNLPLLEFALAMLWEEQDGWLLTHEAYEIIGRVEGALARHAEDVYAQLSVDNKAAARRIFTQMIRPGGRTEDTRRLATRQEISTGDWRLVQHLADARLLVTGRDSADNETAELVHEALISAWDRLQKWLAEDRAFRLWQERLRAAMRAWQASDGDEDALLRGRLLAEAEGWLLEQEERFSSAERAYVMQSQALRDRETVEREQARLAQERARRRIIIGLATLLLIVVAALVFALGQNRRAEAQARIAFARELTSAAVGFLESDPELSILLALQALRTTYDADGTVLPEAEQALHHAIQSSRLLFALPSGGGLAFDPDGARLATGGKDGQVTVADSFSGETLANLPGLKEAVTGVAFSPDGVLLAAVSERRHTLIWDLANGEVVLELPGTGGSGPVLGSTTVSFSPNGNYLLLAGPAQDTSIWEVETGHMHVQIENSAVADADFSPDGSMLALTAAVWELPEEFQQAQDLSSDGQGELRELTWEDRLFDFADAIVGIQDPSSNVSAYQDTGSVAYSPNGEQLITSVISSLALMLDAANGELITTLPEHAGIVHSIDVSPDGDQVATASADGIVRIWQVKTEEIKVTLQGHQDEVVSVAFHPNGDRLASGSLDGKTRVWDISGGGRGEWLSHLEHQGESLVVFDPHQPNLITVGADNTVSKLDVSTGMTAFKVKLRDGTVSAIALSQDGERLAIGLEGGGVVLLETITGRQLAMIETGETISSLVFGPNNGLLVSGDSAGDITIWNPDDQSPLATWSIHDSFVNGLVFSPDGDRLASVSADGMGFILSTGNLLPGQNERRNGTSAVDVPTEAKVTTLIGHKDLILSLSHSPDGKHLVTASWDGTAIIWDASTGESLLTLAGHRGQVVDAAYGPGGSRIATAGSDGQVILWDAQTGEQLLVLASLEVPLKALDYSSDGSFLAVSTTDGSVHVYTPLVEDLMELAQSRLTRSLTDLECQTYLHLENCP